MLKRSFAGCRDKASVVSTTICTTIFFLLSSFTYGQHVVSGVVRDAETNELLINATVHLKETGISITDPFGRFRFENVPSGQVVLRVTYIGYKDHEQTVDISADAGVEIKLDPASIVTDAVVVRATRATGKTPTTFTNITREKIEAQNFG